MKILALILVLQTAGCICTSFAAGVPAVTFSEEYRRLRDRHRSDPENPSLLLELAMHCYAEAGEGGNAHAVSLAEESFRKLLALQPMNTLAYALLGSSITMHARDTKWPLRRLQFARDGNKVMDEAIAKKPNDTQVRWVRAENNFHMPAFMGRGALVREDLTWLWTHVDLGKDKLTLIQRQEVAMLFGRLLDKQGKTEQAVEVWNKGLTFSAGSAIADRIKALIADSE
jgi:hypothetical protein